MAHVPFWCVSSFVGLFTFGWLRMEKIRSNSLEWNISFIRFDWNQCSQFFAIMFSTLVNFMRIKNMRSNRMLWWSILCVPSCHGNSWLIANSIYHARLQMFPFVSIFWFLFFQFFFSLSSFCLNLTCAQVRGMRTSQIDWHNSLQSFIY